MAEEVIGTSPEPSRMDLPGMSLLEHLEELRKRFIYSLIGLAAGFSVAWIYVEDIFRLMELPIKEALRANQLNEKLVYTNPTDPFNIYLRIALIAGLFLASPVVLYQLWMFISPGLYRHEKRYVLPFMFATVGLFLGGGYFGYRYVYPKALTFLIEFGKDFQPMITVGEYTDLFLTVVAGMGAVFELPTVIFFLALMGVVDAKFLVKNFRYAVLIIFLISGILTPTTDLVNLCIFAAPMLVLYIVSIGLAWFVHPARRRKALETAS